jgi:hypothetical protein
LQNEYYAGIGSRETPEPICQQFTRIASFLRTKKYILRSGGADGADMAFEKGAGGLKEIWLPWPGFNNSTVPFLPIEDDAYILAKRLHPNWRNLKEGARKLHARNCHQILGKGLQIPVKFVICWTSDGKASGGTGQAMRLAMEKEIPIYNLFNDTDRKNLSDFLQGL